MGSSVNWDLLCCSVLPGCGRGTGPRQARDNRQVLVQLLETFGMHAAVRGDADQVYADQTGANERLISASPSQQIGIEGTEHVINLSDRAGVSRAARGKPVVDPQHRVLWSASEGVDMRIDNGPQSPHGLTEAFRNRFQAVAKLGEQALHDSIDDFIDTGEIIVDEAAR